MKRCWSLVLLAIACCVAAQGQTPLSVAYQKTLQLPVAGATAAYSLDPNIADATAANGVLEIFPQFLSQPGTNYTFYLMTGC